MTARFKLSLLTVALMTGAGAWAQTAPLTDEEYKAAVTRAEADYGVARERCDTSKGTAKDICIAEAKATEKRAKADALAAHKNTAEARYAQRRVLAPWRPRDTARGSRRPALLLETPRQRSTRRFWSPATNKRSPGDLSCAASSLRSGSPPQDPCSPPPPWRASATSTSTTSSSASTNPDSRSPTPRSRSATRSAGCASRAATRRPR